MGAIEVGNQLELDEPRNAGQAVEEGRVLRGIEVRQVVRKTVVPGALEEKTVVGGEAVVDTKDNVEHNAEGTQDGVELVGRLDDGSVVQEAEAVLLGKGGCSELPLHEVEAFNLGKGGGSAGAGRKNHEERLEAARKVVGVVGAQLEVENCFEQFFGGNGRLNGGSEAGGSMGLEEMLEEAAAVGAVGRRPLVPEGRELIFGHGIARVQDAMDEDREGGRGSFGGSGHGAGRGAIGSSGGGLGRPLEA